MLERLILERQYRIRLRCELFGVGNDDTFVVLISGLAQDIDDLGGGCVVQFADRYRLPQAA